MQTGIQPKLTYTLNVNEIQPILTYTMKWKTTILCMCNDLGMCDAAVDLTGFRSQRSDVLFSSSFLRFRVSFSP